MIQGASQQGRLLADGRIDLPEVTLVAVSSLAIGATLRALRLSTAQCRFGAVRLLTDAFLGASDAGDVEVIPIAPLGSRDDYSRFMLRELATYVDTPFMLGVQWDGYVLNGAAWRDEFLRVDYVGAPWPQFADGRNVGNGGFSLRSKRLLEACRDPRIQLNAAEDLVICRNAGALLEREHGIVFAPERLARAFAYERTPPTGREFGFHGVFNMPGLMDAGEFRRLYSALENRLRGKREAKDLMNAAISHGDVKLFGVAVTAAFFR
jgi:hypothetical protein